MEHVFPVLGGQCRLSKKINLCPRLGDWEVSWHSQERCSNSFLMALATEENVSFCIRAYFIILVKDILFFRLDCVLRSSSGARQSRTLC